MCSKIAIIGAGPSGLSQLLAFEKARKAGEDIPVMVCFEKQKDLGGQWNFTWRTGLDEHGVPVHSGMYRHLWSNAPKECIEYPDYSIEEHFGRVIPSYPTRPVCFDYLKGRAERNGVQNHIRFSTLVLWVTFIEATQKFMVFVKDLIKDEIQFDHFDYVIVATGHFSIPNVPYFPGVESFPGRVLHSHAFRDAREFTGMDVLVVGSSYSAEDVASQCYKYGSRSVTISYRTKSTGFKWPDTMKEVPLLSRLDGKIAHFKDSITKEVDAVILCTGYQHDFPFLPDDLRLKTENIFYPLGLYKGIFWVKNPKLMYLGMQNQYFSLTMFDAQAWYSRDVILGRIPLPTTESMNDDIAKWQSRDEGIKEAPEYVVFQADYISDLIQATDYPRIDMGSIVALFMLWKQHKRESIMGFRNNSYVSPYTGALSPVYPTPWLDAFDDSLESFLNVGSSSNE